MTPPIIEYIDFFYFLPFVAISVWICYRWSAGHGRLSYGLVRMLAQLSAVGFALGWIFSNENILVILALLGLMLFVASTIANNAPTDRKKNLLHAIVSIALGCFPVLATVIFLILKVEPWYTPRFLLPLAGMILANAMNPVSLASERWFSEIAAGKTKNEARGIALKAAMIPPINSCLAVGLVSLPGMMTGQILSGTDPLIATRYQILVMLMVVCAGAISSAIFLKFKSSAVAMPRSET